MYVFDLQVAADIDYTVGSWYVSTHPDSPFLGQLIVARTGHRLRKTLSNGSFAIHRLGEASERVQLRDVDAVLEVLRDEFGIQVPEHPELRTTIERLLASE
ncbi:Arylamine N-acetyltransferase [compost metagenome]